MLDRPFARFVAPDDIDLWSRNLAGLLDRESRLDFELTLLRGDGLRLCAQLDGLRLAREGVPTVVLVVLTDIGARKQAEIALREQESFFRLIAENLGDFIAVLDPEGRRIYSSPSYQWLFGDGRDLAGTDCFAEVHEDDRPRIKQAFHETLRKR